MDGVGASRGSSDMAVVESRRGTWLGVLLGVAAMAAPLVVGILAPTKSPLPFVATVIVLVLVLGYVIWRARPWIRPRRRARRLDYVLAAVPLLAGVVALFLVRLVADAYGIQGSALPRAQSGWPGDLGYLMAVDLAYLAATAATVAVVVSVLGLVVLLARTHLPAGTGHQLLEGARGLPRTAEAALGRSVSNGEAPVTYATGTSDSFWRRLMSPVGWGLLAVNVVAPPVGLWLMIAGSGEVGLEAGLMVFAAAPVTGWAVLESLWRPDEELGIVMAGLRRTLVVPFVAVPASALVTFATGLLPQVGEGFERRYWPHNWNGMVPTEESSLYGWLAMATLISFTMGLLAGLAVAVAVVFPAAAIWRPQYVIKHNMMSRSKEHRASNTAAARAMSLITPLVFLIVILLKFADEGSVWWWLGILLIPVGVGVVYFVWSRQRVDHEARAKSGLQAQIPNPNDPPPTDSDHRPERGQRGA